MKVIGVRKVYLFIDNYDSFVHNLARYFSMLGVERKIVRNDRITVDEIRRLNPEAIIISPGPCSPAQAGISKSLVKELGSTIPVLGVCLGHQCIAETYGGRTIRAKRVMHAKTSMIDHSSRGLFMGLPNPLQVARYHSLTTDLQANGELMINAVSDDGEVMAVRHARYPVYGVQFHPESILTEYGIDVLRNFLTIATQWNETNRKGYVNDSSLRNVSEDERDFTLKAA